MPLCTLKVSQSDFDRTVLEGKNVGQIMKDLCKEALDITVKKLRIPDENDVEMLVIVEDDKDQSGSKVEISFTCGDIEYPTFNNDVFDPKKELIQEACEEIQKIARNSAFEIKSTRMEAWKGTTFEMISTEDKIETNFLRKEFDNVIKAETTLIISPEFLCNGSYGKSIERGSFNTENFTLGLRNEISEFIHNGEVKNKYALMADTDIGVTVDIQGIKEIPENIRKDIAGEIRQSLGRNMEGKSATIWIRPGNPEVYQSISSN